MENAHKLKTFVLDQSLADDVVVGVKRVFKESFGLDLTVHKQVIETNYSIRGDVSGAVGMVQQKMEGNLVACFPRETILEILSSVYGREFTEVDDLVKDGVGEITNIIYGQIKHNLNNRGYAFQMAIPNVVLGSNHSIHQSHNGQSLVIQFGFGSKTFEVSIALQEN